MNALERLRNIEVSPRTAAICVVVLLAVAVGFIMCLRNSANSVQPDRPGAAQAASSETPTEVKIEEKTTTNSKDKTTEKSANKDTSTTKSDPYAVIAERNIFRPVKLGSGASGVPAPPKGSGAPPDAPPSQPGPPPQMPGMPGGGRPPGGGGDTSEVKKNLAFTGVVETPSGMHALLENISSKETSYVAEGGNAFGCRVVTISDRSVILDKDGSQFSLTMGENKPNVDPGAKPAGGEQKPPQGGPNQPG